MATLVESALRGRLCLGTAPDWPLLLIFFQTWRGNTRDITASLLRLGSDANTTYRS